jgi:hypothetical protein
MNKQAIQGKNYTIRIFASVLLFSIHVSVSYHIAVGVVDPKKLIQQLIRFGLTILLMYFIFKGKTWAKNTLTVLLALGIIMASLPRLSSVDPLYKLPLVVAIVIYSAAIYQLNFSKNFKEYFKTVSGKL